MIQSDKGGFIMSMKFHWYVPTNGDGHHLGLKVPEREPSLDYLIDVAKTAENAGFEGILVPTGSPYLDSWVVGSAIIHHTERIKPLIAFRPGFISPTVAAKMAATLDELSGGRLLVNVVTGGSARELAQDGDFLTHRDRYLRTDEFLEVVQKSWSNASFNHEGDFFSVTRGKLYPPVPEDRQIPVFFSGSSIIAKEIAAKSADVYLQWGEPVQHIKEQIEDVNFIAQAYGRQPEFGVRIHVIVRDTEEEAWEAAYRIISKAERDVQQRMAKYYKEADSVAQQRMNALLSEERFDTCGWSGIGQIRKGAGTALVGTPEQVKTALDAYAAVGVTHFILSGFPHLEEAERFGQTVLPLFEQEAAQA